MSIPVAATLEAVLFAAGEPVSKKRLATLLGVDAPTLRDAAIKLRARLEGTGLALLEADEEIELRTASEAAPYIQQMRESELSRDLGKAGLEALAVILYKKGATRGEIDWVRGVNSAAALRSLQMRGLVTRNEDVSDRRRIRYTATIEALAHLGITNVRELPQYEELGAALSDSAAREAAALATHADTTTEGSNMDA